MHVVRLSHRAQAIGPYSRHRDEVAAVLTDIAMPLLDGHALIAALMRIDPEVRIIVADGSTTSAQLTKIAKDRRHSHSRQAVHCRSSGAHDFGCAVCKETVTRFFHP